MIFLETTGSSGIFKSGQWKGWLSGLGEMGPIIQNLITIIGGIATAAIVIFLVGRAVMLGIASSKAETAQDRKVLKTSMMWFIIGAVIIIIGVSVTLSLLTTIGGVVKEAPKPSGSSIFNICSQYSLVL